MAEESPALVELRALDEDSELAQLDAMLREFNLFDVLGIARREIRHSALLAWLLNPRASHGIGGIFLRQFLSDVTAHAQTNQIGEMTPLTVESWVLENVRVVRERQNIDVLVVGESDRFVCPIENKINIDEHSGQLGRYMTTVQRQWPEWSVLPVFLTPDGKDPAEPEDRARYVPFSHEGVATILDRILSAHVEDIDPDVASLLRQYTYTLRRRVMETTSDVESLAFEIYGKHRAAINRINRALANREKRAAWIAEQVFDIPLEETIGDLLTLDWNDKVSRSWASPHLDSVCPEKGQMLVFQVKYERDVSFYIWIRRAKDDEKIRRRLLELARTSEAPFSVRSRTRKKLNKGWTWIYKKRIIARTDDSLLDVEATKEKVEQALLNFYETDYYPIVNAIRQEFKVEPVPQP